MPIRSMPAQDHNGTPFAHPAHLPGSAVAASIGPQSASDMSLVSAFVDSIADHAKSGALSPSDPDSLLRPYDLGAARHQELLTAHSQFCRRLSADPAHCIYDAAAVSGAGFEEGMALIDALCQSAAYLIEASVRQPAGGHKAALADLRSMWYGQLSAHPFSLLESTMSLLDYALPFVLSPPECILIGSPPSQPYAAVLHAMGESY